MTISSRYTASVKSTRSLYSSLNLVKPMPPMKFYKCVRH
eukprot:CAMPEP_0197290268 /NCGR_PEP_ID=MMETSP0890-20130614/7498_1 /TAXON_ID=44058 ORGANISM="Aureoumbra lagunensis, Strain CCMP1510" /NCGR_SAMPLE_ID=MMETSP0890 /ASSEMBLY_ACC=CAM_ASM_000533 /LENGTH=38 /DNA_ID= /DNA_START= /DNA_END= /DNA_ORIENTATION=